MRVGIIGTGNVGQALGKGLVKSEHEVMIGTREPGKLSAWQKEAGTSARVGSNAEAAKFGEMIIFCPKWEGAKQALELTGKENFAGKIVIDTTNPLKFTSQTSFEPAVTHPQSCAKILQEWIPAAKVVKCFNTVPAHYMANPSFTEGKPDMFIAGNDSNAKQKVSELCQKWGWNVNDVGDVNQAYLVEGLALMFIHMGLTTNNWNMAWKLLRK